MIDQELVAILLFVTIPTILFFTVIHRWMKLKERKMELDAVATAEKAAQYATRNNELEQRVRVLEKIVTDGGAETAAQIEALRRLPEQEFSQTIEGERTRQ